MTFEEFKDAVLAAALAQGATAAEVYYESNESARVGVYQQKLDTYSMSYKEGLNLRVIVNGHTGSAYTEILENPEELAAAAIDNAGVITASEEHPMQGACTYAELPVMEDPLQEVAVADRVEMLKTMEKQILAQDPRVVKMSSGSMASGRGVTKIYNTLGLAAEDAMTYSTCMASAVVAEEGEVRNSYSFKIGASAMDYEACGREAVQEALDQLGAAPVATGTYDVVFRGDAFASILSAFFPMFSAENAQKGMSLLAGREGTAIASPLVTIMDDPFYARFPRAFDAEGTPSVVTTVVENGELRTLLHNLKTAAAAGVASTSNAGRDSAAASISIAPSTFYVKPGEASYEELLEQMGDGLVITDVSGLHAGLNPISGSFSLLAAGFLVEGGCVVRSVNQITVAGSFESLFGNIAAIGSDLKFTPSAPECFGAPSVYVKSVQVAGK